MFNIKNILFVLIFFVVSGCAFKPYNSKAPEEYDRYWSKEKNQKNSLIYILTDQGRKDQQKRKHVGN